MNGNNQQIGSPIPEWQLPAGVSPGTWDYTQLPSIASDYDRYFADHPLFKLDEQLVLKHLPPASPGDAVADLGCGTGRALIDIVSAGFRGLAIDLSQPMLGVVQSKITSKRLDIVPIRANLVSLDGLKDGCVDHGISLFSTLGMIRGRNNRIESLRHARRIIKDGGNFVLHVHNTWSALYDPEGPAWLINSIWRAASKDHEFGDRVYRYRGLPNMFLHNYRLSELKSDLAKAGFKIKTIFSIDRTASRPIAMPRLMPRLRAGGFIAICD